MSTAQQLSDEPRSKTIWIREREFWSFTDLCTVVFAIDFKVILSRIKLGDCGKREYIKEKTRDIESRRYWMLLSWISRFSLVSERRIQNHSPEAVGHIYLARSFANSFIHYYQKSVVSFWQLRSDFRGMIKASVMMKARKMRKACFSWLYLKRIHGSIKAER